MMFKMNTPSTLKMITQSEKKLIIASAPQNLDTRKERVVQRFIPLLVAENLTRIAEYESGRPIPRVDLWNCVGMRMDKSFADQTMYASRREFSSALLADKYAMLNEFGISCQGRDIIRDDDNATKTWFEGKIKQLFSSGIIYIDLVGMNICNNCNYLQSVENSFLDSCSVCNSSEFHIEKRRVLMVDIPPKDRNSLINDKIIHPKNISHIRSFFDQLPPRSMISKIREYGLSLDSIGLEGYVLDPKIGVALMPELVAEKYHLSELTLVQGASIAANTMPYTSILTSGFNHTYLFLPKIPKISIEQARDLKLSFFSRYLPLILMTYNNNIKSDQFKIIQENYARIRRKIDSTLSILKSGSVKPFDLLQEDYGAIKEIIRDFSEYKIRDGQEKFGKFFKNQGRRYTKELRGNGYYLNPRDVNTLEDIVKLFYG